MMKFLPVLSCLCLLAPAAHATLNVTSGPTQNVSCVSGLCTATGDHAVLNADELSAMLQNTNVTVATGKDARTIAILTPVTWSSTRVLRLRAAHDVVVWSTVAVEDLGGVVITTGAGGDLKFKADGKIRFWDEASKFVFNDKQYVLARDLTALASAYQTNPAAYVALMRDYDAGPDGVYPHSPIPKMSGTFEGLGHTVSNLRINSADSAIGMFGETNSGVLRNITLTDADIVSTYPNGGVVGVLAGAASQITGAHVLSGKVRDLNSEFSEIGGLVGQNNNLVLRSDAAAEVSCLRHCFGGGLAGYGKHFTQTRASGKITGGPRSSLGGLVGFASQGVLSLSYATSDVFIDDPKGKGFAGGLLGQTGDHETVKDSYAFGTVNGARSAALGGLFGKASYTTIATTYAAPVLHQNGSGLTGGFMGVSDIAWGYTNNYWSIDTTGQSQACGEERRNFPCEPGFTGLTDAQLKSALPLGFDPAIWGLDPAINNGYPYLLDNPPQ